MNDYKQESHPKQLPACKVPGCSASARVIKSWVNPSGARMQRVECERGHRLTGEVQFVPVPASLNRLLRRQNRQF